MDWILFIQIILHGLIVFSHLRHTVLPFISGSILTLFLIVSGNSRQELNFLLGFNSQAPN